MIDGTNTNNMKFLNSANSSANNIINKDSESHGVKATLNFFKSIESNEIEELNNILENDLISKHTLGSGLIKAMQNYRNNTDTIDIIDSLLNHNADPNHLVHIKNNNQQINLQEKVTVLMYACLKGDLQLIHTILKHKPNVNMKDSNYRNALFYAINAEKGDNVDIVLALINEGINVNDPERESNNFGHSPLTLAASKNMRNTVKTLLDHGADPNWVAKDGDTALHFAVRNSNIEIINKLISKNANLRAINKENFTPLSLALKLSRTDIYKLLCEEHNKILALEDESAKSLIIEKENENPIINSTISSVGNTNPSSKIKKKKKEDETIVTSRNDNCDISNEKVKNSTNNISIGNNMNNDKKNAGEIETKINLNINNNDNNKINMNYNTFTIQNQRSELTDISQNMIIENSEIKENPSKKKNVANILNNNISNRIKNKQEQRSGAYNTPSHSNPYYAVQSSSSIKYFSGKSTNSIYNPREFLEIPFEFKGKMDDKSNTLCSYIKLQSTPTLFLDFSDKEKEDCAILSSQLEDLKHQLLEKNKTIKNLEESCNNLAKENKQLINDIGILNESNISKEKYIVHVQSEGRKKEEQFLHKISELDSIIEEKSKFNYGLSEKCDKLEKELNEIMSTNTEMMKLNITGYIKRDYLEKKFSTMKYEDKYIIKCLQKDILDFQDYIKDQIKTNKQVVDDLLMFIQASVNECIPDYELKLYGSHATNLCLPWSDLDMVLINKRTGYSSNYGILQTLYLNLLDKPWKKTIKFIDTAIIPIIKITSTEDYNSMQMDISLQDGKHYGLKCVELVRSFISEYEALEPLIFVLKNLLKNANLNDPYTGGLSSYGLILMVVSYLQSQLESKKSIKVADGNIGRLFLEFLCYYGLIFDHTKYVIYTYSPIDLNYVDKDNNNFFFNMQSGHELIIVDPLNKSNNVARSTYQFVNIKMAFMIGFVVSREECECGCHFNQKLEDTSITSTDHCILKRIFNSVKRFNANAGNQ